MEGEKDVETLKALGFTPTKTRCAATTNPMGAGKWRSDYNQYFKDKEVVILPDNDEAGRSHAREVALSLNDTAKSIKMVELPHLEEKEDVSDWAEKKRRGRHGKEMETNLRRQLLRLIEGAPEWRPGIFHMLPRGSDLVKMPGTKVRWVIKDLLPRQAITLLHGRGGIGKTWLSLAIADSVSKGKAFMGLKTKRSPVVYVDFENSLPLLVERIRKLGITKARFWHNQHDQKPPKLDDERWEDYKRIPKNSLLIFDTLRAAQSLEENNSKDMAVILNKLKELRERGNTIVLLHHAPKSNEKTYKGSTAILDLADHVLALYKVKISGGKETEDEDDDDIGGIYRFGTKLKTRYEPFHMYLSMEKDRGFVLAPDPNDELLRQLHRIMLEHRKETGRYLNQKEVIEKAESSSIGKDQTRKLLKKGEGSYWISRKGKKNNAIFYRPRPVIKLPSGIYRPEATKPRHDGTHSAGTKKPKKASKRTRERNLRKRNHSGKGLGPSPRDKGTRSKRRKKTNEH